MHSPDKAPLHAPILNPHDVIQLAFLLENQAGYDEEAEKVGTASADARKILGQLAIQWRSALGDRGSLSTFSCMCRVQAFS